MYALLRANAGLAGLFRYAVAADIEHFITRPFLQHVAELRTGGTLFKVNGRRLVEQDFVVPQDVERRSVVFVDAYVDELAGVAQRQRRTPRGPGDEDPGHVLLAV